MWVHGALLAVFLAASAPAARAAAADADEGLEIPGLILDETKTRLGRDFFDSFNAFWHEVVGLEYTIAISEIPSDGRRGTFVGVSLNETQVYFAPIQPRLEIIEEEARKAVAQVSLQLLQQLADQRLLEEEFQY